MKSKKTLASKLQRYHDHVTIGTAGSTGITGDVSIRRSEPSGVPRYRRLAQALGGELVHRAEGSYCLVRRVYGWGHCHGDFVLTPGQARLPLGAFTADDQPGELDVGRLLFVDTETTGLGGTGSVAFLVGCGSLVADGFEVRQYVIPDYSDEASVLEALLEEFTAERSLVSYNGAAFDLPLLTGRMIVNRSAREVVHDRHVDLLHAARRLFKRRLGDCSLVNVERQVLGFERVGDIPGYLIPSVYFDWVSEERTEDLEAVLEHNRLDIFSLFFLLGHIVRIVQTEGRGLTEYEDLHSLSRLFGRRRQVERVVKLYERVDELSSGQLPDDVVFYHAMAFKRSGDMAQAVSLWERLSGKQSREAFRANVELAKYYEHRQADLERAFEYARQAEGLCPDSAAMRRGVSHRLARLVRRREG
jgi:hypothetical protein